MADKWFINTHPRIPLVLNRVGTVHVAKRKVEWLVNYDLGSSADFIERPPKFAKGEFTALAQAEQAQWKEKYVTTEERTASQFKNEIEAPNMGGLKINVRVQKAAGDGAQNIDHASSYETWRKLYITLNYMTGCEATFDAVFKEVKAEFAKAFIDLEVVGRRATTSSADVTMQVSSLPGAELKHLHNGDLNEVPVHIRCLVANKLASEGKQETKLTVTPAGTDDVKFDKNKKTVTFNTKTMQDWRAWGHKLTYFFAGGLGISVSEAELAQLTEIIVDLEDNVWVELKLVGAFAPLYLQLLGGKSFGFDYVMKWTQAKGGAYVLGTRTLVCSTIRAPEDSDASWKKRLRNGLLHEIAHAIGMVRKTERKKGAGGQFADWDNPLRFVKMGGVGQHCKTGSHEEAGKMKVDGDDVDLCVMFHSLVSKDGTKQDGFCQTCREQLLRVPVEVPSPIPRPADDT
ncbi:MAG: hypothetical protein JST92_25055 [Deltaproteobacteria bacterium]|nr:hypothetical protein [Deltaproteobacteria bacterium]